MPKSSVSFETFASPDELREVILDMAKYPEFLPEVKKVVVHERSDTAAKVSFYVEVNVAGMEVKTEYTCAYTIGEREITWTLDSSPDLTQNDGSWKLEETEDGETIAHYESELVTSLPIPAELQKIFADQEMPKLMERFRDRVEE